VTDIDREKLRAYLDERVQHLNEVIAERKREDPEDDVAVRMEGGQATIHLLNLEIDSGRLDVESWPQTPIEKISVPPEVRVRRHARGTSWEAALSLTPESTQRMYRAIYLILSRLGPMTDYEIRAVMTERNFKHSHSGVSARRVELERAGWIRGTGEKRPTPVGGQAEVWEAVPEIKE